MLIYVSCGMLRPNVRLFDFKLTSAALLAPAHRTKNKRAKAEA